jgi:very-short-patch-repair endonuclease
MEREKMREYANRGIIGVFMNNDYKDTKPEKLFKKWCKLNDIVYEYQYKLRDDGHHYDFILVDTKIIVEVDGEYWHNTDKQQAKDNMFDIEAEQNGYTVFRFTDTEIYKSKSKCFDILKEHL